MAVRKRKVRKLRSSFFAFVIFIFSFILYLTSSLFLRTYNVSLSRKLQTCTAEIERLTRENNTMSLEIQQLSTMDRVMAIASEEDMSVNSDSIVTINADTER